MNKATATFIGHPIRKDTLIINWQKVIVNLKKSFTYDQIKQQTGGAPLLLRRIYRGSEEEPHLSTGILLLDLHADTCPDKHNKLTLLIK